MNFAVIIKAFQAIFIILLFCLISFLGDIEV